MTLLDATTAAIKRSIPPKTKKYIKFIRAQAYEKFGSYKYSRPSINQISNKLDTYLTFDGGTYIECGANDGFSQSNTYFLARHRKWRGLLIEPVPDLYALCRKFRPESRVINAALSDSDGNYVTIAENDLESRVSSTNPGSERLLKIPARRLSTILDEENINNIDLFSLDVEGYELPVLNGIDFDRHIFNFLLIETSQLDRVIAALPQSFRLADKLSHHDYLFVR